MDQSKMLELQLQMKQNNSELQDFMRDLDSWEGDMKTKDEALKLNADKVPEKERELPPIRNSLEKKKKKKKVKEKKSEVTVRSDESKATTTDEPRTDKPQRISSYDFRAWDKFDVDKAIEEIDVEGSSSSSEYETDEEWEMQRKQKQAEVLKDQGNQLFKSNQYDKAIESYTGGLDCDPENAVLYANRAMALLKQDKFGAAEFDCTAAISLDPMYVKAYARRASARIGLGRLEDAMRDFEKVLKLEPTNKFAKSELEKLDKRLNPLKYHEEVTSDTGIVKAIYKPPEERSKKPLMRIKIEEIGVDHAQDIKRAIAETEASQSDVKRKEVAKDAVLFENFMKNSSSEQQNLSPSKESLEMNEEKSNEFSGKQVPENETLNVSTRLNIEKGEAGVVQSDSLEKSRSPDTSPRLPPVPATSFQFQADWKVLKQYPEKFYQYFKAIDPGQYVKLFGQALDADILLTILTILQDFYITSGQDVFHVLQNLTTVKRFSMVIMFMSSQEKQVLSNLISHLRKQGSYGSVEVDSLAKRYGL